MCFPSPVAYKTPTNPAKYPLNESYKAVRSQANPVDTSTSRPPDTGSIPKSQSAKPATSGASLKL